MRFIANDPAVGPAFKGHFVERLSNNLKFPLCHDLSSFCSLKAEH